jgi:hypothetical protein
MRNNKICVSKKILFLTGVVVALLFTGIVANMAIEKMNNSKLVTNSKASSDGMEQSSWCYGVAGFDVSITTSVNFLNQKGTISICKDGCDPSDGRCRGSNSVEMVDLRTTPFCGNGKKYCFDAKNYSLLSDVVGKLSIRTFSIDCDQDTVYSCQSGKCASDGSCVPMPTPTAKALELPQMDKKGPSPTPTETEKKGDMAEFGNGWLIISGEDLKNPSLYNPKFINDEITQSNPELVKELQEYKYWYGENGVSRNKLTNFVALRQVYSGNITEITITNSCHKGDKNNLFNFQNIDNNRVLDQCQNAVFQYFQDFTSGNMPLYLKAVVDTVKKGDPYKPLSRRVLTIELKPGKKANGDYHQFILYAGSVNSSDIVLAPGTTLNDYEKVIRLLYFTEFAAQRDG